MQTFHVKMTLTEALECPISVLGHHSFLVSILHYFIIHRLSDPSIHTQTSLANPSGSQRNLTHPIYLLNADTYLHFLYIYLILFGPP